MIAIDTSAVIAILWLEAEAGAFLRCIGQTAGAAMSAVNFQETAMVLAGRSGDQRGWPALDRLVRNGRIDIVPHDEALARIAREAFLRYGKGRHPARLNLGDCAAYALAKGRGLPLLFKGTDFARTDVLPALPP